MDKWIERITSKPYAIFDVEDKAVEEALRLSFQLEGKPLPTVDTRPTSKLGPYLILNFRWKVEHWK